MAMSTARLARARRTALSVSLCLALAGIAGVSSARKLHEAPGEPAAGNVASVSSCADDGSAGTLRAAVAAAADGDTINLSDLSCSLITLASGAIVVPVPHLAIVGPGQDLLTIDAHGASQIFRAENLDLSDLTIANGAETSGSGGGCVSTSGDLTLTHAKLTTCLATNATDTAQGGAARVLGKLTMHQSTISESKASGAKAASGGGAHVLGVISLYSSIVSNNLAEAVDANAYGGGLFALGPIEVHGSTIDGNAATSSAAHAYGGGLHGSYADISILESSTISNNRAHSDASWGYGGGVSSGLAAINSDTTVTIDRSTVTGNAVGSNCSACLIGGGGVRSNHALVVTYSTLSYNSAGCDNDQSDCSSGGGAIAAVGPSTAGSLTMRNTTISSNESIGGTLTDAFGAGGAILGGAGVRIVAHNSTIAFNHASSLGGGIAADSSAASPSELVSTIVADNDSDGGAGDIVAGPFSGGLVFGGSHNMVTAAADGVTLPGDTSTDEPLLLPLTTAEGGTTAIHALADGSSAIQAGANPDSLACDQRGAPHLRVVGGHADIGAYESDSTPSLFADGFDQPAACP